MTQDLLDAIDHAIDVAAARYDHALEMLAAEHDRLEQLGDMRAAAERLAASSSPPVLPAAAEPADGLDTHAAAASAPAPAAALSSDEPAPAAARPVDEPPESPARSTRAGGPVAYVGRDGLTAKQSAILTAVNSLGECSVADVCEAIGRDEPVAVGSALKDLRRRELIGHNGKLARAARYQSLHRGGSGRRRRSPQEAAKAEAQRSSPLDGSIEQRVELALKWAKTPLKLDAICTRCKATTVERQQVEQALAYMEADGRASCDAEGRWTKTERLAEAA